MSAKKQTKTKKTLYWLLAVVALAVLAVLLLTGAPDAPAEETEAAETYAEEPAATEALDGRILRDALRIRNIGKYVGIYVEDGSDEAVSGVLMLEVENISSEPIQYAQINLTVGEETAEFTVSVLPAGGRAILIEQNRMAWEDGVNYGEAEAECVHLAGFDKPLSLHEDKLKIQLLDGAANILNVSDEPIEGTIVICYKNVANGMYHGGIAYRIRIEGGMKAGELKQIMATHLQETGSEILFVDIVE